MKTAFRLFSVMALSLALGSGAPAWALSRDVVHTVTVTVGQILSITIGDDPNFTLEFTNDFDTGAVSDTGKTVNYTIRANNMTLAALPGALSARVSSALAGVDLRATLSDYVNQGGAGFATLQKVGDNVIIGTTATAMYDKPASASRLMRGVATAHYRGVANRPLSPGDGGTTTLTVTVKDI